jgi:hypothetical protein
MEHYRCAWVNSTSSSSSSIEVCFWVFQHFSLTLSQFDCQLMPQADIFSSCSFYLIKRPFFRKLTKQIKMSDSSATASNNDENITEMIFIKSLLVHSFMEPPNSIDIAIKSLMPGNQRFPLLLMMLFSSWWLKFNFRASMEWEKERERSYKRAKRAEENWRENISPIYSQLNEAQSEMKKKIIASRCH